MKLHTLTTIRRSLLKKIVPEFIWPRFAMIDGVKIKIRGEPYSFGVKKCLQKGVYEQPERTLVTKFLEPGMQVLEMGCSIGILTAIVSKEIGLMGRVVSIEADRSIAEHTATWLENGNQTKILNGFAFPVWKLNPDVCVSGFNATQGSLGGTVEIAYGVLNPDHYREDVYDISRVCAETGLHPDVLICDIEGSESVLLNHRLDWPKSISHVLIELHPKKLAYGSADVDRICRRIANEGFDLTEVVGLSYWFSKSPQSPAVV